MTPEGGYVINFRSIWSAKIFKSHQEAAVFVWMVATAQWRDTVAQTTCGDIPLSAGELLISERGIAEQFGLHRNVVRRLLHAMVADGCITLDQRNARDKKATVCRVTNYEQYQGSSVPQTGRDQSRTSPGPVLDHTRDQSPERNSNEDINLHQHVKSDFGSHQIVPETSDKTSAGPVSDQSWTKNNESNEGSNINPFKQPSAALPPAPPQPAIVEPAQADLLPTAAVLRMGARDLDHVIARWNAAAREIGLAQVKGGNDARERAVRKALKALGGLDGVDVLLARIGASNFLAGRAKPRPGQSEPFRADFDWVFIGTRREGPAYSRILEGKYDHDFTAGHTASRHDWKDSYEPGQHFEELVGIRQVRAPEEGDGPVIDHEILAG